ncbi:MAG TPA: membrane protein insertase YidC [Chloroflexota bacterium]|nr:membrane protein insertase YidC [Chloroflexota bacterium]
MDIGQFWHMALVYPLIEALVFLAAMTGSSGWAIILLTLGMRTLLFPLAWRQVRAQKARLALEPLLHAARRRYGRDPQRLNAEIRRIHREQGVSFVAGCLPALVQAPVLFALYQALTALGEQYAAFQQAFAWVPSLAAPDPWYLLPVLLLLTQIAVQRIATPPSQDPQQRQLNRVSQVAPVVFSFVALRFPAGLVLYWVVSNAASFVQQYFLTGWGQLFPGGWQPRTPLAGSWQMREATGQTGAE